MLIFAILGISVEFIPFLLRQVAKVRKK